MYLHPSSSLCFLRRCVAPLFLLSYRTPLSTLSGGIYVNRPLCVIQTVTGRCFRTWAWGECSPAVWVFLRVGGWAATEGWMLFLLFWAALAVLTWAPLMYRLKPCSKSSNSACRGSFLCSLLSALREHIKHASDHLTFTEWEKHAGNQQEIAALKQRMCFSTLDIVANGQGINNKLTHQPVFNDYKSLSISLFRHFTLHLTLCRDHFSSNISHIFDHMHAL